MFQTSRSNYKNEDINLLKDAKASILSAPDPPNQTAIFKGNDVDKNKDTDMIFPSNEDTGEKSFKS